MKLEQSVCRILMAGLALVPVTARAQLSALHARRSRATDARAAWMRVRASIKENIFRAFVVHLTEPKLGWILVQIS
jgi:hypothetical protein